MRLIGFKNTYQTGSVVSRDYVYSPTGNILSATDVGAFEYASGSGNQAFLLPELSNLLTPSDTINPTVSTTTHSIFSELLGTPTAHAQTPQRTSDGPSRTTTTPKQSTGTTGGGYLPGSTYQFGTTTYIVGSDGKGIPVQPPPGPGTNPPPPGKAGPFTFLQLLTMLSGKLWQIFSIDDGIVLGPYGTQTVTGDTVLLRQDRIGKVKILPGDTTVHITYTPMGALPHVTLGATSQITSDYWITNKSNTGFDIVLSEPQTTLVTLDWYAYAIPENQIPVYTSNGTTTGGGTTTTDPFTNPIIPTNNTTGTTTTLVNEYANPQAVIKTTNQTPVSYIYDPNGNIIQHTDKNIVWKYAYDLGDNLISAQKRDTTANTILSETQYTYSPTGKRTTKCTIKPTPYCTYYYFDTYETTSTNSTKVHINFGGTHTATLSKSSPLSPTTVEYYHNDPLGTSQVVTAQNGSILSVTDTLPFGEVNNQTATVQPKPRDYYALHERDTETNLIYMQARYYSDTIKRFSSLDPAAYNTPERFVTDPQQLNLYSYARNNPVQYNDPSGEAIDDPLDVLEIVAGFVPVGGEIVDGYSAITGKEAFGGEPISQADRYIAAGSIGAPLVGGRLVSESGNIYRGAQQAGKYLTKVANEAGVPITQVAKTWVKNYGFEQTQRAWSGGRAGDSYSSLIGHFVKHGSEFGSKTVDDYYKAANNFIGGCGSNCTTWKEGASTVYWNAKEGIHAVTNGSGAISTFQKPSRATKVNQLNTQASSLVKKKK